MALMMVTIIMCVHGAVIYALVHGVRGGRAGASALAIVTLLGAVSAGSIPSALVALALGVATLWAVWLESGAARHDRGIGVADPVTRSHSPGQRP
ncbi:hypothetical protein ASC54_02955 [Yonghaparkia sp. Root332]|nr:hypothetical protein ASC54_02955 [Yonghaparkia sp. Root332]